ncbi:hypothetical protein ZWY2020_047352 [Hordeum vulgare]|nr:hypothetical protein ZWY2020_047352 [Hordeum vulgare]
MDSQNQAPQKFSSFSSASSNKAWRSTATSPQHPPAWRPRPEGSAVATWDQIKEECEDDEDSCGRRVRVVGEIDAFIVGLNGEAPLSLRRRRRRSSPPPSSCRSCGRSTRRDKWANGEPPVVLAAIARIAALASAFARNPEASSKYASGAHRSPPCCSVPRSSRTSSRAARAQGGHLQVDKAAALVRARWTRGRPVRPTTTPTPPRQCGEAKPPYRRRPLNEQLRSIPPTSWWPQVA